jgi:fructose-1,6-bisphosphatase I
MSGIFALLICSTLIASTYPFSIRKAVSPALALKKSSNTQLNAQTIVAPIFEESCEYSGITLTRYLVEFATANPKLRELESLILALQTACKSIANVVERASITGTTGLEGGGGAINVQGEEQKRLDVITNDIMKRALRFSGKVGVIASEEEDNPVAVDENIRDKYQDVGLKTTSFNTDVLIEEMDGKYIAVFDPLDGSSNVDAGIPTGTIFGIFEEDPLAVCEIVEGDESGKALSECLVNTLRPGSSLVAAGYCLYSSSVFFCLTLGTGVNIFTLDRQIGEFVLTHPNLKIPKRGKIYSFNEANRQEWDKPLVDYVTDIQTGKGESGKQYSSRYIGSMVGDVHRTLLYGGIFGYPGTHKNKNGKLRLLYEAAPMSFLMEQAGGMSITGKSRIMDIVPKSVHQRVPCLMGSTEDIAEVKKYYDKCTDPEQIKLFESRAAW